MKRNILAMLCSSTLVLTACGGGSDSNNDTDYVGKEKLDFNKADTISLINEPVVSLSNEHDNPVINIGSFGYLLHEATTNPKYTASCQDGKITTNGDTVTLEKCKNLKISYDGEEIDDISDENETIVFSGKVQSSLTESQNTHTIEITLSQFVIDTQDETLTYNGKVTNISTKESANRYTDIYQSNNMTYKLVDKEQRNKTYQYNVSNYKLSSEYMISPSSDEPKNITNAASGQLTGSIDAKGFDVKFNSVVGFATQQEIEELKPNTALIDIQDVKNDRNEIRIQRATNGQATVSAFADAKSVSGFPKTVDWDDFY